MKVLNELRALAVEMLMSEGLDIETASRRAVAELDAMLAYADEWDAVVFAMAQIQRN